MNTSSTSSDQFFRQTVGPVNVSPLERLGSTLAGAALAYSGLKRGRILGTLSAAAGTAFLYRGLTGHCPVFSQLGVSTAKEKGGEPVVIDKSLTVYKPRSEVYGFWRKLKNLPKFMEHLASVEIVDEKKSNWSAWLPSHMGTVEWQAEILEDQPDKKIVWRSLPGAEIYNAGTVRFEDAPDGNGTEVHVTITYQPGGGAAGSQAASLLNPGLAQMVKEDLRRFKSLMEAGEMPTVKGQPSGR